jgi:aquaporin Z
VKSSFLRHWPEYLIEAFCLGMFMVSACLCAVALEHPDPPLRQAVTDALVRRALMGLAMGLTAVALIYSPWGKRSGAHMNPAVTWTFFRLGKIAAPDAAFYTLFQALGGWAGVMVSAALVPGALADPRVHFAVTAPGPGGAGVAFVAEFVISFVLLGVVLWSAESPRLSPYTGVFVGLLLFAYITIEAPLSGTSLNPARTLASALPAGDLRALWVYFSAPVLGMLTAGEAWRRRNHVGRFLCAKMEHDEGAPCIFCGQTSKEIPS